MSKLIPKEQSEVLVENDLPEKDKKDDEELGFAKPEKEIKPDDSFLKEIPKDEEDEESLEVKEKEEKPRVPQKRFDRIYGEREEFRRRAEDADKRVDKLAELLEQSLTASQQRQIATTAPEKWRKILGEDNPKTDEFYALLNEEMTAREQRAAETALSAWEERQQKATSEVSQRTEALEVESEEFAESVGIDASTKEGDEQLAAILEIQDEATPQQDGKYTQPLIPIQVAYELYKSRIAAIGNPQKQRKLQAADAVGAGKGDIETPRSPQKGRPDPGGWRKFLS